MKAIKLSTICLIIYSQLALAQSSLNIQTGQVLQLPTTARVSDVAIVDLNHDGRPDLAVAERGSNSIAIYLQQASGGYPAQPTRRYATPYPPHGLVATPLDNLSAPVPLADDLVVVSPDNVLTPYLNDGTAQGNLSQGATTVLDWVTTSLHLDPDYVTTARMTPNGPRTLVSIARNTGGIKFGSITSPGIIQPLTYTTGTIPRTKGELVVFDLNGDGVDELVFTCNASSGINSRNVCIDSFDPMLNGFQGRFVRPELENPTAVAIGDVTGDGLADLVVAANGTLASGVCIVPRLGPQGSLNFPGSSGPFLTYPLLARTGSIYLQDLTGDNRPEIIVSTWLGGINILENTGGTGLGLYNGVPYTFVSGGGRGYAFVRFADLDADGDLDLVAGDYDSNSITLFRNQQVLATKPGRANASWQAYPNPAEKSLRLGAVPAGSTTATLRDLAGRQVRQWTAAALQADLAVGDLPRGVYLLQLSGPAETSTRRVVLR